MRLLSCLPNETEVIKAFYSLRRKFVPLCALTADPSAQPKIRIIDKALGNQTISFMPTSDAFLSPIKLVNSRVKSFRLQSRLEPSEVAYYVENWQTEVQVYISREGPHIGAFQHDCANVWKFSYEALTGSY